ncbi:hypothetical protein M8C21_018222, partial [Ambrosia artemisiifolia]
TMSNSSLTSSPARSSISTTAIVGGNGIYPSLTADEVHFQTDLTTFQERKEEALKGFYLNFLNFVHLTALTFNGKQPDGNRKDANEHLEYNSYRYEMILQCNAALKSDLVATLNKEVRMLDEDSWMFEGPRSRIHLISRPGGLLSKHAETNLKN